jgi:hypothetical protein
MDALNWTGSEQGRWLALPVDEELALYRLLAYTQRVHGYYREHKLYPHLDALRDRLSVLVELQRRKAELVNAMPRDLTGFDLRTGELLRSQAREDEVLSAIDKMIALAVPELDRALGNGMELKERLSAHIHFEPVGLMPLHTREGYLLLRQSNQARVYAYQLTTIRAGDAQSAHQEVRTRYIADYTISFACTYESVKADLVRTITALPNPAVFAFTTDLALPAIETFVPLAKQLVYDVVIQCAG